MAKVRVRKRNEDKATHRHEFRPGQFAPKGYGKKTMRGGVSLTDYLLQTLQERAANGRQTKGQELIQIAYHAAREGDYQFFRMIWDRVEGKCPDNIVVSEGVPQLDLTKLSSDELELLNKLLAKADRG